MIKKHCIDCNKELSKRASYYNYERCSSCAAKERIKINGSPNLKHGKFSKKFINYCECGKIIDKRSKNCTSCHFKLQWKLDKYKNRPKGKKHPFYGKHHTEKTKRKISRTNKMSGIHRGKNNSHFGKLPSHGKRIKYKEIYFRSSWESSFAKWLNRHNVRWNYEPKTFDLGNTTYTPDFYLPQLDTYIEIKGFWRDDAKKKYDLFKKLYSKKEIILLQKPNLLKLGVIK